MAVDQADGRAELDDALVDKIAAQSDEQAAGLSIRELERIRDENLVAIMQRRAPERRQGLGRRCALQGLTKQLSKLAKKPVLSKAAEKGRVPSKPKKKKG